MIYYVTKSNLLGDYSVWKPEEQTPLPRFSALNDGTFRIHYKCKEHGGPSMFIQANYGFGKLFPKLSLGQYGEMTIEIVENNDDSYTVRRIENGSAKGLLVQNELRQSPPHKVEGKTGGHSTANQALLRPK